MKLLRGFSDGLGGVESLLGFQARTGLGFRVEYYWGFMGIMEKKMETTI